jgi:ferritin-like protein
MHGRAASLRDAAKERVKSLRWDRSRLGARPIQLARELAEAGVDAGFFIGSSSAPRACRVASPDVSSPAMSSETYHEPIELLSEETRNMHRAIVSLKEELEAVDWYQQRAEACSDDKLREVLIHNKNEEIEHAMMNLEWIRRHSEVFDANIKKYIGAKGDILAVEQASSGGGGGGGEAAKPAASKSSSESGLGIGSLRKLVK